MVFTEQLRERSYASRPDRKRGSATLCTLASPGVASDADSAFPSRACPFPAALIFRVRVSESQREREGIVVR